MQHAMEAGGSAPLGDDAQAGARLSRARRALKESVNEGLQVEARAPGDDGQTAAVNDPPQCLLPSRW